MNKTYNQLKVKRSLLVDRHIVSGNYPVIFQIIAFQKVIQNRRQIHCLHC